jgi:hypothetical protein
MQLRRVLQAIVIGAVWLVCAGSARAQNDVLSVEVKKPLLVLGDDTVMLVEVRDRRPDALRLPEVDGLVIGPLSEPSYQSRTTYIGQRFERQESWIYHVPIVPERAGNFRVPPVVAVFGAAEVQGPIVEIDVAVDDKGEAVGYLAIALPFERVVVGQGFALDVTFGVRESLYEKVGGWDVTLPWLGSLGRDAVQAIPPSRQSGTPVEITVNRASVVPASAPRSERIDDQDYRLLTLRLFVTPLRSGTIDLSGSVLRVRTGRVRQTAFGPDFRMEDEFFKRIAPLAFEVEPLPDTNRPLGFTGAVGSIAVDASVDVTEMFAGDSFKLTVDFTGAGNLGDFAAPNLELDPAFTERFALYGASEERSPDEFRVVYDLAPLSSDVTEVPPVGLWIFDPVVWDYRLVRTDAVPISVRSKGTEGAPTGAGEPAERVFERDLADIRTTLVRTPTTAERAPSELVIASLFGATAVVWLALRTATRRGNLPVGSAVEKRRAVARFERALARASTPEQDLAAWADFVAGRLGGSADGWIGRDVRADVRVGRLELGDVAQDLLARTGARLEEAAFGDSPRVERSTLVATARDLMEEGL